MENISIQKNQSRFSKGNIFRRISFDQFHSIINRFDEEIKTINSHLPLESKISVINNCDFGRLSKYRNIENFRKAELNYYDLDSFTQELFDSCLSCSYSVKKLSIDSSFWADISYDSLSPLRIEFYQHDLDEDSLKLFEKFKRYDWKNDYFF